MMKNKQQRQARQTRLAIVQVLYQSIQLRSGIFKITKEFIKKGSAELDFENNNKYIEKIDTGIFYNTLKKIIQSRKEIYKILHYYLPDGKNISDMNKIPVVLCLFLLASCGLSQEEKEKVAAFRHIKANLFTFFKL